MQKLNVRSKRGSSNHKRNITLIFTTLQFHFLLHYSFILYYDVLPAVYLNSSYFFLNINERYSTKVTYFSLRMFVIQVLANKNAKVAVPLLFWPPNYIKIWGHVSLLIGPTVYLVYFPKVILLNI